MFVFHTFLEMHQVIWRILVTHQHAFILGAAMFVFAPSIFIHWLCMLWSRFATWSEGTHTWSWSVFWSIQSWLWHSCCFLVLVIIWINSIRLLPRGELYLSFGNYSFCWCKSSFGIDVSLNLCQFKYIVESENMDLSAGGGLGRVFIK